jgi:hypothetical protein
MKVFHFTPLIVFLFSVLTLNSSAQEKPETVYSIRVVHHENEWYLNQIRLWKMEVDKNPKNPDAWYNYYKAYRYANFTEAKFPEDKIKKFNEILADMEKQVPQSFEYAFMQHLISECGVDKERPDFTWLEEAYRRDPQRTETYDEFINRYEIHEANPEKLKKYCDLWYHSQEIPSFLLDYNYNVLVSADDNAIIFTNGDNDTYPLWLLQQTKGISKDVTVLNIHLIKGYPAYLIKKLNKKGIVLTRDKLPDEKSSSYLAELCDLLHQLKPDIKLYCALTMNRAYIEPLQDKLFLTGLVNQYSTKGMDNFALLKRNILRRYRLDYLQYDWYHERHISLQVINYLNANYVIPFMKLAEHLYLAGDKTEADCLKQLALTVAQAVNIRELINFINEKEFK